MDSFVAEIRIFTGDFPPMGWALCDGQILPISQNTALFSLIGTMYGGNGTQNFALPNLQARIPMQAGLGPGLSQRSLGEAGGEATHALLASEMPSHNHTLQAVETVATASTPSQAMFAKTVSPQPPYHDPTDLKTMGGSTVGVSGGSQPHNNLQPYLVVNYIISLQGIYPARS